jgi:hypothetical protein
LNTTVLDKKIVKGIQDTPCELKKTGKTMGFKHGGMVKKTGKALVIHKGEFFMKLPCFEQDGIRYSFIGCIYTAG